MELSPVRPRMEKHPSHQKYFPGKTYHTMIPRSVKLAEAPSYGKPVLYYEKYCKASFAYKKLADEVVKQSR